MDNMKTGARVYRVKDYTTEIRLKWKYSCNYTLLPKHFPNQGGMFGNPLKRNFFQKCSLTYRIQCHK